MKSGEGGSWPAAVASLLTDMTGSDTGAIFFSRLQRGGCLSTGVMGGNHSPFLSSPRPLLFDVPPVECRASLRVFFSVRAAGQCVGVSYCGTALYRFI